NREVHRNLWGRRVEFRAGAFRGRLPSVRRTVARFGEPLVCDFRKGWFADTLPAFEGHVDVALLDVDLLTSTRTCLQHLVPPLRPRGVGLPQGRPPAGVRGPLGGPGFWRDGVGGEPARLPGVGAAKLLAIEAPTAARHKAAAG